MSIEALWVVTPLVPGVEVPRGVVVLETQRILGGDHSGVWVGTYRVEGDKVHAKARVTIYDPSWTSALMPGVNNYEQEGVLTLSPDHKSISGIMTVVGKPHLSMQIGMVRVAELP